MLLKYSELLLQSAPAKSEQYTVVLNGAKAINAQQDSLMFIRSNKLGTPLPPAIQFESYWDREVKTLKKKPAAATKVDYEEVLEAMPPEKGLKRAQARLKEVEKELSDWEKKRAGMKTLAEAYNNQPMFSDSKTLRDLEKQLDDSENEIDTLRLKRFKYQMFIAKVEGSAAPESPALFADHKPGVLATKLRGTILADHKLSMNTLGNSDPQLLRSTEGNTVVSPSAASPSVASPTVAAFNDSNNALVVTEASTVPTTGSSARGRALYEFRGNMADGELSVNAEEMLEIFLPEIEGWVKAKALDGREGFVPASYVQQLE